MLNATFSLLFIGAPVFLLGVAVAFRRSMQIRRKNAAPFRGYFASIDDSDLLQHSDLSETDDWQQESQFSFVPFRLRTIGAGQRRSGFEDAAQPDGESN